MATLQDIVAYADRLLDAPAMPDYCPNGLQVAGRDAVRGLVTGVTASQALLDAALAADADAILVHHGYFWKGEDPRVVGPKQRRLAALLRADVSLIAYHLPLDVHPELGNNAQLARVLDLRVDGSLDEPGPAGLIHLGRPSRPLSGAALAAHIAERLDRPPTHVAPPDERPIARIAWCTGAGQRFIEAAAAAGVDAFVSGEISEPTAHSARELGLHYFAAGHHATERYGVQALGAHLADRFGLQHKHIDIDNPA